MNNPFDKKWQNTVRQGAEELGISLDQAGLDLFSLHAVELIRWNRKTNLTAITDPFEVALKHFVDSIALAFHVPDGSRVMDLGSGGGFPGFPLKVVRPGINLVMADASRKRVSFLKHLIRTSGMMDVIAVHARAEELGYESGFFENFDFVVSRAFTSLEKFALMAAPFLKNNGKALAMKGKITDEEIHGLSKAGGSKEKWQVDTVYYLLPFENHERTIVTLQSLHGLKV